MPNQILGFAERGDRDIALIDEMEMRRAGLVCLLAEWTKSNSIAFSAFASPAEFIESEGRTRCRMVILSIGGTMLDEPDLIEGIEQIRSAAPQASLVILSDHKDPNQVVAAFHSGSKGFMSTDIEPDVALRALGFILCGGSFFPPQALADLSQTSVDKAATGASSRPGTPIIVPGALTSRQREVLDCLRHGKSNKQIARELNMQESTVKVHVRQIMRRLGVKNRVQAAIEATRLFDAAQAEARDASETMQDQVPGPDISVELLTTGEKTSLQLAQQVAAGALPRPAIQNFGIHLKGITQGPLPPIRPATGVKH